MSCHVFIEKGAGGPLFWSSLRSPPLPSLQGQFLIIAGSTPMRGHGLWTVTGCGKRLFAYTRDTHSTPSSINPVGSVNGAFPTLPTAPTTGFHKTEKKPTPLSLISRVCSRVDGGLPECFVVRSEGSFRACPGVLKSGGHLGRLSFATSPTSIPSRMRGDIQE